MHDIESKPVEQGASGGITRKPEERMRKRKVDGGWGMGEKREDASDVPYILSRRVYQPRDAERPSSTNHRPWSLTYLG